MPQLLVMLIIGVVLSGKAVGQTAARPTPIGPGGHPAQSKAGSAATASVQCPLTGTAWRLVEFRSMDDGARNLHPKNSQLYTMRFNRDGSLSMQLNCNQATGIWVAEPGEDANSGRFKFGPLATTRARCPPPSMDQRIAADAAMVRGYLLREDCLYLSLMADAGIYVWKRLDDAEDSMLPDSFERNPDAALQEAIRRASPDYTEAIVETGGGGEARYLSDRYDLNGDGRAEVFAYLMGSIFCGTGGCNLLLFEEDVDGYRLVSNLPLSRLPIIVSDRRSNGWRDLLKLESGGGAPSSFVRYAFDGKKYVEQARLPAQPIPVGVQLLLPRGNFDDGIPLAPRS